MAIDRDAYDKFLKRVLPDPPPVKTMPASDLDDMIYNCTGAHYKEKTISRPHQLPGVAFALYQRRALLFYWMRLGKSKMAVDWASHLLRANIARNKGLIVSHATMGTDVWQGQITQHSNLSFITIKSGKGAVDRFLDALESDCQVIIASRFALEELLTIKRFSKRLNRNKIYPDIKKLDIVSSYFDWCVIDETHNYANPYSLTFLTISALVRRCRFRLGLTGTPVGRNPFAIWSQAFLIDEGQTFGGSVRFFQAAFGREVQPPWLPRPKLVFDKRKMQYFQYKLDSISIAYGKDEVKSAKVFAGKVELSIAGDQREAYNRVVDEMIKLRTDEEAEIKNSFVKLRQIASGYLRFKDDDGKDLVMHFKENAKMRWFEEFLADLPKGTQCLIYHDYVHTGALLSQALVKAKISHDRLYGQTKDRQAVLSRYKSGKSQVLVAHPIVGGVGIDLPQADYLCFYESPCSPIIRAQAEARPMARGTRPLYVDDLVCAPIEAKVLSFIAEGNNLLASLLKGGRRLRNELRV